MCFFKGQKENSLLVIFYLTNPSPFFVLLSVVWTESKNVPNRLLFQFRRHSVSFQYQEPDNFVFEVESFLAMDLSSYVTLWQTKR